MQPGTVLLEKVFRLSEDGTDRELLVLLSSSKQNPFIVVRTTSKPSEKRGLQSGCQVNDELPNFFLPLHSTYLKEDTWIRLDEIREVDPREFRKCYNNGEIDKVCRLPKKILEKLLVCAISCGTTSEEQKNNLWDLLSQIETFYPSSSSSDL